MDVHNTAPPAPTPKAVMYIEASLRSFKSAGSERAATKNKYVQDEPNSPTLGPKRCTIGTATNIEANMKVRYNTASEIAPFTLSSSVVRA